MGLFPRNLRSGILTKLILNMAVDLNQYNIMFLQKIRQHS